jgi:hypothetical protein
VDDSESEDGMLECSKMGAVNSRTWCEHSCSGVAVHDNIGGNSCEICGRDVLVLREQSSASSALRTLALRVWAANIHMRSYGHGSRVRRDVERINQREGQLYPRHYACKFRRQYLQQRRDNVQLNAWGRCGVDRPTGAVTQVASRDVKQPGTTKMVTSEWIQMSRGTRK